ncbi:hypothetical protein [Streptomyces fulvorobeus]|uniref:Anti-sigma factor RsiW n=1 Tax=Streptomyces fulvorobeus TaxID=284028 RepID=A0A7J0CFC7_9ACTN|nr:hypothetical protein [Streptomyces fulvorobeus]NYE44665.1 anti-sigma factor RsiW [Streptomyces fulvorobeus]GFN01213.1 hypothetical protein Sfulv_60230 [Streptomyces fulvorobeus]
MAGLVNQKCVTYRPVLTERLLLGVALTEELCEHLDRCPECSREMSEISDVVRTLRRADPLPSRATPVVAATGGRPSVALGDRIRRDIAGAVAGRHRIRRRITLGVAAAAFVAAAAVAVPLTTQQDPAPASTVALARQGHMVTGPGGTEVPVVLSGLRSGEIYRMMTVNADGVRSPGGSVRAPSTAQVSTRMVTAMHRDTITALIVEDDEGRVVAHLPVTPLPLA